MAIVALRQNHVIFSTIVNVCYVFIIKKLYLKSKTEVYRFEVLDFSKTGSWTATDSRTTKTEHSSTEASAAIFQELKKKGKVESYYGVSGIPSGFAVVDVSSHNELNELLVNLPITMFGQIELYPLITIESAIKTMKKMIAQLPK